MIKIVIVSFILICTCISTCSDFDKINAKSLNINSNVLIAIKSLLAKYKDSKTNIYFKDLSSKEVVINIDASQKVLSASLIKLIILIQSLKQKQIDPNSFTKKLKLSPDNVVKGTGLLQYVPKSEYKNEKLNLNILNYLMIVKSDNTAANMLIDYLGIDKINNRAAKIGLKNTKLINKLMLPQNNSFKCKVGICNYTSAEDVAKTLEYIYSSQYQDCSFKEALMFLNHQTDNLSIPSLFFNEKSQLYNKTGTLTTSRYNASIIEHKDKAYILVITVSNINPIKGDALIKEVTNNVYRNYILRKG